MHALAMGEGVCRKKKLFTAKGRKELEALALGPWASYRRQELLRMFDELQASVTRLDQAVEQAAKSQALAVRLMTHPGVGEVTALTFVLTIGDPQRFASGRHLASYLGLIPQEASSGGKQRLGRISKQGNALLRGLLAEAAHIAVRHEPELGRCWRRLAMKKNRQIATVAVARKLAVRLWWMWIRGLDYGAMFGSGSHAG